MDADHARPCRRRSLPQADYPSFEGFIKPTECKQPRYVVQKSVTAALDYAAALAQASVLFAPYEEDYPGFSEVALQAAERAYAWAEAHPQALYHQDLLNKQYQPAVVTGAYGDRSADDEFFWAASELYLATGKLVYREQVKKHLPLHIRLLLGAIPLRWACLPGCNRAGNIRVKTWSWQMP